MDRICGRASSRKCAKTGLSKDRVAASDCRPVIQEVFQGLRPLPQSLDFETRFLALPRPCDPLPLRIFTEAASIYRQGRRKGYTIRYSMDCLIAAIAIDSKVAVWHKDRDFHLIAQYTALEAVS